MVFSGLFARLAVLCGGQREQLRLLAMALIKIKVAHKGSDSAFLIDFLYMQIMYT